MIHKSFLVVAYLIALMLWSGKLVAFENSQRFGDYELTYTLLPSTMLTAEVARIYQIKRSPYEVLLNVSVTPVASWGGVAVSLSGTISNLLQQQKTLDFKTITEDGVTYYLAPIRVSNEEIMHFNLSVVMPNESEARTIQFTRTLYAD